LGNGGSASSANGVDFARAQNRARVAKFAGQFAYFHAMALVLSPKAANYATNTMEIGNQKLEFKGDRGLLVRIYATGLHAFFFIDAFGLHIARA
jgi:hypothetical protein